MIDTAARAPPRPDTCARNLETESVMTTSNTNRVLEQTPSRVLVFIRAVGINADIRRTLADAGYSEDVHAQGWDLLQKTSGVSLGSSGGNPVSDAIHSLSDWNAAGFHRIHAALAHLHPGQESFVFKDLAPASGIAAVLSVATLLDRLDALDGVGPEAAERKATADADKKATATLASRGIDDKERKRLRDLVKTAQSAPMPTTPSPSASDGPLLALQAWFEDWSETAKAVITKRGDLIKLGLAKRISRQPADDGSATAPTDGTSTGSGTTPPPPVATAPTTVTPPAPPVATPTPPAVTPAPPAATPFFAHPPAPVASEAAHA